MVRPVNRVVSAVAKPMIRYGTTSGQTHSVPPPEAKQKEEKKCCTMSNQRKARKVKREIRKEVRYDERSAQSASPPKAKREENRCDEPTALSAPPPKAIDGGLVGVDVGCMLMCVVLAVM